MVSVGLFATCLVDSFRPSVGFAALKLLRLAGCSVAVPSVQSCCGQPAYNSGDKASVRKIVAPLLDSFSSYDYVVVPSGSCCGMLRLHLRDIFDESDPLHIKACAFSEKCYELTWFLLHVLSFDDWRVRLRGNIAYHSSCSSLREIGLRQEEVESLLGSLGGSVCAFDESDVCCGFGGLFCVKYESISGAMVSNKVRHISSSGADILVSGDLGCLLNISGRLRREGSHMRVYHIAELLADMLDVPALGEVV